MDLGPVCESDFFTNKCFRPSLFQFFGKGRRISILLKACPAHLQTNLPSQPIGSQLLPGLVCKFVGQTFNEMLTLPPFWFYSCWLSSKFGYNLNSSCWYIPQLRQSFIWGCLLSDVFFHLRLSSSWGCPYLNILKLFGWSPMNRFQVWIKNWLK